MTQPTVTSTEGQQLVSPPGKGSSPSGQALYKVKWSIILENTIKSEDTEVLGGLRARPNEMVKWISAFTVLLEIIYATQTYCSHRTSRCLLVWLLMLCMCILICLLKPWNFQWNICHRQLVSIQLCLVMPSPLSSNCTMPDVNSSID